MTTPPTAPTARPAVAADRAGVIALVPRLRAFGPPPLRPPESMDDAERRALERAFDDPIEGSTVLVVPGVGTDGAILGVAYAERAWDYFTGEEHAHLAILAVAAEAEGRGVGRALLEAVERWAADHGDRLVTLSVFETNERARAVYERMGYAPDTVRYVKELGAPRAGAARVPRGAHELWLSGTRHQFHATLDMLGDAIAAFPDALWLERRGYEPWYLAYHTLFWTDLYLSASVEAFAPPPPFTLDELEDDAPPRAYTQAELHAYLAYVRAKLDRVLGGLTAGGADTRCGFEWLHPATVAEVLTYNLRHVQHGVGQLNLLLRLGGVVPPRWVKRGRRSTA